MTDLLDACFPPVQQSTLDACPARAPNAAQCCSFLSLENTSQEVLAGRLFDITWVCHDEEDEVRRGICFLSRCHAESPNLAKRIINNLRRFRAEIRSTCFQQHRFFNRVYRIENKRREKKIIFSLSAQQHIAPSSRFSAPSRKRSDRNRRVVTGNQTRNFACSGKNRKKLTHKLLSAKPAPGPIRGFPPVTH